MSGAAKSTMTLEDAREVLARDQAWYDYDNADQVYTRGRIACDEAVAKYRAWLAAVEELGPEPPLDDGADFRRATQDMVTAENRIRSAKLSRIGAVKARDAARADLEHAADDDRWHPHLRFSEELNAARRVLLDLEAHDEVCPHCKLCETHRSEALHQVEQARARVTAAEADLAEEEGRLERVREQYRAGAARALELALVDLAEADRRIERGRAAWDEARRRREQAGPDPRAVWRQRRQDLGDCPEVPDVPPMPVPPAGSRVRPMELEEALDVLRRSAEGAHA